MYELFYHNYWFSHFEVNWVSDQTCPNLGRDGQPDRRSCGVSRRVYDQGDQRHQESPGVPIKSSTQKDHDDALHDCCGWSRRIHGPQVLEDDLNMHRTIFAWQTLLNRLQSNLVLWTCVYKQKKPKNDKDLRSTFLCFVYIKRHKVGSWSKAKVSTAQPPTDSIITSSSVLNIIKKKSNT